MYLDFSRPILHIGKGILTRREFLELYIHLSPKTKMERDHNRAMMNIAETRAAEVLLEIKNNSYGRAKQSGDFLDFLRKRAELRNKKTRQNWHCVITHLENYAGKELSFERLTKNFHLNFKEYLDTLPLGQNSKQNYFSIFKCVVKEAFERGLLKESILVKNFASLSTQRPFLTNEDIQKLVDTEFERLPDLRRAAFFSILTSLRWSDTIPLNYEDIKHEKSLGYYIDFTIKKKNRPDRVYLNDEVLKWCEYEKGKTGRIFKLKYWHKNLVADWFKLAEVREINGFHQFRHTFGMKNLNEGEDIAVVSAMMGHLNISTTQKYARILGKTKREASHRTSLSPKPEEEV